MSKTRKSLQDFFPGSTFAETTTLHFGPELDGPIPDELWSLGKLIGLEFVKCPVVVIPDEIAKLKKLRWIRIDACKRVEIAPAIGKLAALERLDVLRSGVEQLPEEIGLLRRLETMMIAANPKLAGLPASIAQLKQLEILSLVDNKKVPKKEIDALRKALKKTTIYS